MLPIIHLFRLAAATAAPAPAAASCDTVAGGLIPSLWDGMCTAGSNEVDIDSVDKMFRLVGNAIRIVVALSGVAAIIVIIIAGIYYVISVGDAARVKRAKDILTNTVIGLILIIAAYSIITFIADGFGVQ